MLRVLAWTVQGQDAAYLYAQNVRFYQATGKDLYKMVLLGSNQEKDQALIRGANETRKRGSVSAPYNNLLHMAITEAFTASGIQASSI
jgi:hypothetical protein